MKLLISILIDALITAGLACVVYGASLASPALAWTIAGGSLIWLGVGVALIAKRNSEKGTR